MILTLLLSVILSIKGQEDFDRLDERIDSVLAAGEREVDVQFASGFYFFREGHLTLSGIQTPGVSLRLSGDGAYLVGSEDGKGPAFENGFVDLAERKALDVLAPVRKAGFWPVRVPFRKGLYVLRCKGEADVSEADAAGMKIILSQWFVGAVYEVVKISRGWLFFRRVPYRTRIWSELRFGRCLPRYMLFSPRKAGNAYACASSNFLSVENSRLGSVVLDGLHFLGNGEGDRLIRFSQVEADSIVIRECLFEGLRSRGILVENTDYFSLRDNEFRDGALNQVYVEKTADDVRVEGNRFYRNGLLMTNDPVVNCKGSSFLVRGNYFEDFSYSAIGAGLHYTDSAGLVTSGIIEKNEICMSERYRQAPMRSLIDGGAIYIWTQNKDLVIRENYIHDIAGPHGNRGIFGDDGVVNLKICDNTIFRVQGSYAIDVRKAHRVERRKKSAIRRVNEGIVIRGNTYDGRVRLYARRDDPDSFIGDNVSIH
ncbi:MAG: right-handed parallel beta-helix repeat-containing protein [Bacteroidales bacterium]|nr:right-handed parallel beta-helix repeat-containing protein [Bacteroidales bacterium]